MHKISLLLLRSFVFFVISLSNVYAEAEWDINTSKTISYANVSGHVTHGDELRQDLENRDRQRKEELAKQNKVSVTKPFTFSNVGKKDPCRGMGWVNAFEPINKNRLGHSQTWRDNKSKKKYY